MYMLTIDQRQYQFRMNLGTFRKIEAKFKKTYSQVLSSFDQLNVDEQLEIFYYCLDTKEADVTREQFMEICDEYLQLGDLIRVISVLIQKAMNPKKTIEEIEKEYKETQQKIEENAREESEKNLNEQLRQ